MTTWFGLDRSLVRRLVSALDDDHAPETREDVAVRGAFARAAWTMIAEPGDGVAGLVVDALGPAGALTAVLERVGPSELQHRILAAGWSGEPADAQQSTTLLDESATAPGSRVLGGALDRWTPRLVAADLVAAFESAIAIGARLVLPGAPGWHSGLDGLGLHAPHALWLRGSAAAAEGDRAIALVGARAASGYGEHVTLEAAAGLADRRFTIVSGAAYGIDGAAHRAALGSAGITVAYLAGGVDRPYPAGHDSLIRRIVGERGAIISESPCGSTPTKWRFLQRNRLIAAASAATVVLEAGSRSGSINTAGQPARPS